MDSRLRDYTYLLTRLVPHHRLPPGSRRRIERVVGAGDPVEIRLTALGVLEELCSAGYLERTEDETTNGSVVLCYRKPSGQYFLRVRVPREEYAPQDSSVTASRSAERPSAAEVSPAAIPAILRFLAVDDAHESTIHRLDDLIESMPSWAGVQAARLILTEEQVAEGEIHGSRLIVVPERVVGQRPIYERCRRSRRPETVAGAAATALGIEPPSSVDAAGNGTELTVAPVFVGDTFWGVLEMWFDAGTSSQGEVAAALGIVQMVVENALRLQELTSIDRLTQLYNRQFYDRQVRIEVERATRTGSKLTMLVIDIDDFKALNDTMLHQKGDEALRTVAALIQRNLRKIDLAFRYGGEEFVVLLPGTAEVEAIHTAERLRSRVEEYADFTSDDGTPVPLRVSIGAAVFPDHARTEDDLFACADAALYRAKRKGKNRIEFYRE